MHLLPRLIEFAPSEMTVPRLGDDDDDQHDHLSHRHNLTMVMERNVDGIRTEPHQVDDAADWFGGEAKSSPDGVATEVDYIELESHIFHLSAHLAKATSSKDHSRKSRRVL
jgi:hypothetical protein